jgi:hypothetical protein
MGGSRYTPTVEQTGVACWEQQVSAAEVEQWEKKGMDLRTKIYFVSDPGVTLRHQLVVTSRNGTAVASADQVVWDVLDSPSPDVSVGRQLLWRVTCGFNRGEED